MAEAGNRSASKQRWAEPGSAHDWLVRWSKVILPSAVGVLLAVLTLAPLDRKGDVSFILDKKKVENSPERMRVEDAQYSGTDDRGQQFVMTANRAIQRSSDVPIVDISGMFARLAQPQGQVQIAANQGRYNLDTQKVAIDGLVRVAGPNGYRIVTRDVTVDMKQRKMQSAGPASGGMRLGTFEAGQLRADLREHTVVLDHGARLKIVRGAVR